MSSPIVWKQFLEEVTSSDAKHYQWLRSLSYLEFIGYRKMVKSLGYQGVRKGVYHHLSDEINHSFMLQELAEKGFCSDREGKSFDSELMGIAEAYFQDLDSGVKDWISKVKGEQNPYLCYMLVSYIIEKRAMKVYPQYYSFLKEAPLKYVLQKIIKDEKEHLSYLEDQLELREELSSFANSNLWDFEETLFSRFLQQFQNHLAA